MDRKYQIFVSSPQKDLKGERDAVVKSILRLGHIPVGMEMFNAADESSWKLITRYIDDSDFYIVVLAHRYGSLDGEVSFTEKEYDYAVEKGVPTFGFIIDTTAAWPGDRDDDDQGQREKLKKFKEKVARKQVDWWKTADQLSAQVIACMATQIPLASRPGWVRGSSLPGPAVADEISRLSRENAELRARIEFPRPPALAIRIIRARIWASNKLPLEGSANSTFIINSLDGRATTIPFDHILVTITGEGKEARMPVARFRNDEGQSSSDCVDLNGPATVHLDGERAALPEGILDGNKLRANWEFRQLGFEGSYRLSCDILKSQRGVNTFWGLGAPVNAEWSP